MNKQRELRAVTAGGIMDESLTTKDRIKHSVPNNKFNETRLLIIFRRFVKLHMS